MNTCIRHRDCTIDYLPHGQIFGAYIAAKILSPYQSIHVDICFPIKLLTVQEEMTT